MNILSRSTCFSAGQMLERVHCFQVQVWLEDRRGPEKHPPYAHDSRQRAHAVQARTASKWHARASIHFTARWFIMQASVESRVDAPIEHCQKRKETHLNKSHNVKTRAAVRGLQVQVAGGIEACYTGDKTFPVRKDFGFSFWGEKPGQLFSLCSPNPCCCQNAFLFECHVKYVCRGDRGWL